MRPRARPTAVSTAVSTLSTTTPAAARAALIGARETVVGRNVHIVFLRSTTRGRFVREFHRGGCEIHEIKLSSKRFNHNAEAVEAATKNRLTHRCFRLIKTTRLHIVRCWNRDNVDLAFDRPLDVANLSMLTRIRQRDRHAFATSATSAANAMHIRLGR